MGKYKRQRIRDPIHDLIEFDADEFENAMWNVIQTRPFQRLRRIKQLGFSDFVYPGATHSRFAHSIGVFHTARELMGVIENHLGRESFDPTPSKHALAAALVHDLGHGAFSHAFEDVGRKLNLKMADHEMVSDALIRDSEIAEAMKVLGSGFASDVADIIARETPGNIYGAVVSSQFDADRLDYMRRDRLMTGTKLGAIDYKWLIANLEVGAVSSGVDEEALGTIETFVLGPKAVYAAETYVLSLFQLYPTIYLHKTTRGVEKLFSELLMRVFRLVNNGSTSNTGLPAKHPLVKFGRQANQVENALNLDDTILWGSLALMADAKDRVICDLAKRLRDRDLYKSVDVREEIKRRLNLNDSAHAQRIDRACASIGEKLNEWVSRQRTDIPRILLDQYVRSPYKRIQESKGPLNQIRIRTNSGELVDLGERSIVAAAADEPFRLFRVYVPEEDGEARDFCDRIIREEAENDAT